MPAAPMHHCKRCHGPAIPLAGSIMPSPCPWPTLPCPGARLLQQRRLGDRLAVQVTQHPPELANEEPAGRVVLWQKSVCSSAGWLCSAAGSEAGGGAHRRRRMAECSEHRLVLHSSGKAGSSRGQHAMRGAAPQGCPPSLTHIITRQLDVRVPDSSVRASCSLHAEAWRRAGGTVSEEGRRAAGGRVLSAALPAPPTAASPRR